MTVTEVENYDNYDPQIRRGQTQVEHKSTIVISRFEL